MLVISRRLMERIQIVLPDGRTFWITPTRFHGSSIRLGFEGMPPDVKVWREELLPRITAEQPAAHNLNQP